MSLFTRCTGQFPDDSGIVRIAIHTIRSHLTLISIGQVTPQQAAIDMALDSLEGIDFNRLVSKIAASTVDKSLIADRIFAYMILASQRKVIDGWDYTDETNFWQFVTDITGVA